MQRVFLVMILAGAASWFVHRFDRSADVPTRVEQALPADAAPSPGAGVHSAKPPPRVISHGDRVTLSQYVSPGKWTVFDFYSDYCPPCRMLKPELEKLHSARSDVDLVVVDINRPGVRGIDFDSPVVEEYQVHEVPHLVIYDPKGVLYAEDTRENPAALQMAYRWMTGP